MKKKIVGIFVCMLFVISGFASAAYMDDTKDGSSESSVGIDDLEVSVTTDKSEYKLGETVTITISLTNNGDEDLNLAFCCLPPSGFTITDEDENMVYETTVFFDQIVDITVNGGETEELAVYDWDQIYTDGNQVPEGDYTVDGWSVDFYVDESPYPEIHDKSPLTISISKNKQAKQIFFLQFFEKLVERLPILVRLLNLQ